MTALDKAMTEAAEDVRLALLKFKTTYPPPYLDISRAGLACHALTEALETLREHGAQDGD